MKKILVISGHPDLDASNANRHILARLRKSSEQIRVRRLDALYPDFRINAREEQAALLAADLLILQFPLYWYSVPALLKKWLDDVMAYGFAYGPGGSHLEGKPVLLSVTAGGREQDYSAEGQNHSSMAEILRPLEQTFCRAGMLYQPPVFSHEMKGMTESDMQRIAVQADRHVDALVLRIHSLMDPVAA